MRNTLENCSGSSLKYTFRMILGVFGHDPLAALPVEAATKPATQS
jgi:hypothetical protein